MGPFLLKEGWEVEINAAGGREMKNQTETNYHNSLSVLYPEWDKVLNLFRKEKNEGKLEQNWILGLIILPIKNISESQKLVEVFKGIFNALIPLLSTGIITYLTNLWSSLSTTSLILIGVGAFLVTYTIMILGWYLPKMLDIDSQHFHIAAYRDRRPKEFVFFNNALNNSDFTFKGLFHYVSGVLTHHDDESKAIRAITQYFESERESYLQRINELETDHGSVLSEYDELLDEINQDTIQLEQITSFLTELLSEINVILFRMNNGQFTVSDLQFLSGFTLYEYREDKLIKRADHGTSGASLDEISVSSPKFKTYSSVRALNEPDNLPIYQEVRPGYIIVSYRMKMGIDNNRVWVYNFHINSTLNEKAWNLLLNDDILNTSEVYRLFHALCLLLLNQGFGAEGIKNVSS
jgi:hypothetical protein